MSTTTQPQTQDRNFFIFNAVLSAGALCLLAWLLLFNTGLGGGSVKLQFLPAVNACFNATAAVLLVAGRVAVKRGRHEAHRYLMVSAFVVSALFLVGYLAYHAVNAETKFGGEGAVRGLYFTLLISHVVLSVPIVPLVLAAFWFARRKDWGRHVKVTRVLHPVWLYVSVTGVLVFWMLRPYYPA